MLLIMENFSFLKSMSFFKSLSGARSLRRFRDFPRHPRLNMTMKYLKIVLELTLLTLFSPEKVEKNQLADVRSVSFNTSDSVNSVSFNISNNHNFPWISGESYHTHYITVLSLITAPGALKIILFKSY